MLIKYKGKTIGKIKYKAGDCVFTKKVDPDKHLLRMFNAYGIQKVAFDGDIRGQEGQVIIKEKGGRKLKSSIRAWEEKGIVKDLGDGMQIFLPVKYMRIDNARQKQLL